MSRAFVKDDDDRPEPELPRVASERPNYVTPRGLELLHEALRKARSEVNARDVDYFEARIATAIVSVSPAPADEVAFGRTVEAREAAGRTVRVRIVGEDEADPVNGTLSWSAPLAQGLLGHRVGEQVVILRPAGAVTMTIARVEP